MDAGTLNAEFNMRTNTDHIEKFRLRPDQDGRFGTTPDRGFNGVFFLPYNAKIRFKVIVSDGTDAECGVPWEHVSVSARSTNGAGKHYERVPNWEEMCWIKSQFWSDDECVVQFHPKKENYVNFMPNVLHLWKWKDGEFPTPPTICV